MSTSAILNSPDGQRFVAAIAQQFSLSQAQAGQALESLMPAIVAGLARNTASRDGLAGLLKALGSGQHQGGVDDPASLAASDRIADGNAILGHILGSPRKADEIAQRAVSETGLGGAVVRQVLPMLAVFVMGWLFRNGGGMLGRVLGNALGTPAGGAASAGLGGGGPLSMPRLPGSGGNGSGGLQLPGGIELPGGSGRPTPRSGGGPLSMPDLDRIRRNRGDRAPSDNPYGDLGDIVQGGGGGAAAGTIRDILGGLLGFKTSGWLSWIIRFVVLRYGWQILSFVVRRMFMRV